MEVLRLRYLRGILLGKIGPPPRRTQLIEPAIQAGTDVARKGPHSGVSRDTTKRDQSIYGGPA